MAHGRHGPQSPVTRYGHGCTAGQSPGVTSMATASGRTTTAEVHRDGHRFFTVHNGLVAELVYVIEGDCLILTHVGVPPRISGKGVGACLVSTAVEWAGSRQLTVVPWCPFARKWLRAHEDEAARVKIDWAPRPASYRRRDTP